MDGVAMTRKAGLAAMAAALATVAMPSVASAQTLDPIRVGILDLHAKDVVGPKNGVSVVYKEFTDAGAQAGRAATPAGPDHGEIVASAMLQQLRRLDRNRQVVLYSANAFSMKDKGDGTMSLKFSFDQGAKALEWMSQNGVRVVVTAFNSKNEAGSRMLMDKAESLGMIVFAGAPNTVGAGKVYPAADPRAVSVLDSSPDMPMDKDPSLRTWISFGMDGTFISGSRENRAREVGSSYASAKAAGYGAYVVSRMPQAPRSMIVEIMMKSAQRSGKHEGFSIIGEKAADEALMTAVASSVNAPDAMRNTVVASRGPSENAIEIAAASKMPGASR